MTGPKKMNYKNIQDGETVRHSDGSWSERRGDTVWHSDGSWSDIRGDTVWHSDGTWSENRGDTTWHSDGSWSNDSGFNSDGSWTSGGSGSSNSSDSSDSSDSGGCYLTTACVVAKKLPDDCEELSILRWFRDNYLRNQVNGEADIKHYYEVAPKIVGKIEKTSNAKERFERLYQDLVLPCVAYIKSGKYEEAYKLYKKTTLSLETEL